jgi:hypothetical protein
MSAILIQLVLICFHAAWRLFRPSIRAHRSPAQHQAAPAAEQIAKQKAGGIRPAANECNRSLIRKDQHDDDRKNPASCYLDAF